LALILDTGPLVALIDRSDPDHDRCLELINSATEVRVVPVCALVEVEYQLRPWRGGFAGLMADVHVGRLSVHVPDKRELARAASLVEAYADLRWASSTGASWRVWSGWASPSSPLSITATSASCGRRT
jgi:predicted nucleic acid-binding protein